MRPGIARLTGDAARLWSVGGPVARASSLDEDLRRDAPALAYAELSEEGRVRNRRIELILSRQP